MIAGFMGLMSLISRNWSNYPKLHIVLSVFAGLTCFVVFGISLAFRAFDFKVYPLVVQFLMFIMLSALFCDWSLGAMTNNLLGMPSESSAGLYWSYFRF
jgi:hypothetical protein